MSEMRVSKPWDPDHPRRKHASRLGDEIRPYVIPIATPETKVGRYVHGLVHEVMDAYKNAEKFDDAHMQKLSRKVAGVARYAKRKGIDPVK